METRRSRKSVVKTAEVTKKRKAPAADDARPTVPEKIRKVTKVTKKTKLISARNAEPEKDNDEEQEAPESENEDEGDDEAKALARIVDSDAEEDDDAGLDEEEVKSLELPKGAKDLVQNAKTGDTEPGVVYVGRIPRGFFEHQMREYFTQFGTVTKVRMSRNKTTGQSKHFAFVEFAELEVAEIVAKTMDNYLLAGHILKVKMVPKSKVHENLWKGANKRFKAIPWNKMAGNKLKKPLTESGWTNKIAKEEEKRNKRAKKLQALGYEFEAPAIKSVEDVKADGEAALEAPSDEAPKAVEAAPEAEAVQQEAEETTPVAKKASKSKVVTEEVAAKPGKKSKKNKKTK